MMASCAAQCVQYFVHHTLLRAGKKGNGFCFLGGAIHPNFTAPAASSPPRWKKAEPGHILWQAGPKSIRQQACRDNRNESDNKALHEHQNPLAASPRPGVSGILCKRDFV
ncbi:MAG: hypothetical protein WC029_10270 [Sulfuricella sp.]|jgi:hypothetical protein